MVLAVHSCHSHYTTVPTCIALSRTVSGAALHPNKRQRAGVADPRGLTAASVEPCEACLVRGQFDLRIHDPLHLAYEIAVQQHGFFAVGVPCVN